MTTIPLTSGATHVLKIRPDNNMVPATIEQIDNLFCLSKISSDKFAAWRGAAAIASKIAVIDGLSGNEAVRFVDSNFNSSTPTPIGSIWFSGTAEQDRFFYLQAGTGISKDNSADVFSGQYNSYGLVESSGNAIDRCSLRNGIPQNDVTKNIAAVIDKGFKFGPADASRLQIQTMPYLGGLSNLSFAMLIKTPGDVTIFGWNWIQFDIFSGVLTVFLNDSDYVFFESGIPADAYSLLVITWDGTLAGSGRIKVFVNSVLKTDILAEDHLSDGKTLESEENYGDIGSLAASSNNYEVDEFRIYSKTLSQNEIKLIYNQFMDQENYWTVTVQPVIAFIEYDFTDRRNYILHGSGFRPDASDPTITIDGMPCTIISISDSECEIIVPAALSIGGHLFTLTNSDGEADSAGFQNERYVRGAMADVSQFIDAGHDIFFYDDDGIATNAHELYLNVDGYVNISGAGYSGNTSQRIFLKAGKRHSIGGVHAVFADGTDTNIGIHIE